MRDVIRLSSSFVCSHLRAVTVMMPEKRHVEIKRSEMDAKCRNWRRETNGGECGDSKNSANLSHDPATGSKGVRLLLAAVLTLLRRRSGLGRRANCIKLCLLLVAQ
jgi:hypothetical protein